MPTCNSPGLTYLPFKKPKEQGRPTHIFAPKNLEVIAYWFAARTTVTFYISGWRFCETPHSRSHKVILRACEHFCTCKTECWVQGGESWKINIISMTEEFHVSNTGHRTFRPFHNLDLRHLKWLWLHSHYISQLNQFRWALRYKWRYSLFQNYFLGIFKGQIMINDLYPNYNECTN